MIKEILGMYRDKYAIFNSRNLLTTLSVCFLVANTYIQISVIRGVSISPTLGVKYSQQLLMLYPHCLHETISICLHYLYVNLDETTSGQYRVAWYFFFVCYCSKKNYKSIHEILISEKQIMFRKCNLTCTEIHS